MSDVKKSILWALISVPISYFLMGILLHGDGFLQIPYIPGLLLWELGEVLGSPKWMFSIPIFFMAQYLGYFLFIFVWIKIYKALKKTLTEKIAQEPSDKEKM